MANEQSLEDRLIASLFARHGGDGRSVLIGPGDDAAVVRCPPGEDLIITTDTLNEGVHFPTGTPAHAIGHRVLAVSLSDLASMGARPLWAVVTLSSPAAGEGWLGDFANGLFSLADGCGVRVVGGDFVRGPLAMTATAHGSTPAGAALRRDGASAGDGIWVSGSLGDAAAGLELLKQCVAASASPPAERAGSKWVRELNPERPEVDVLLKRFCYPQPRLELGQALAGVAGACMDLSDGLAEDLPRLLRSSGLGARVEVERLPLSAELDAYAGPQQARQLAWSGGDDYELCFTVSPEHENRLASIAAHTPLTRIGEIRRGNVLEVLLEGDPWQPEAPGFRHF